MSLRSADRAAGARRRAFFAVAAGWASLAVEPAPAPRDEEGGAAPSVTATPPEAPRADALPPR